MSAPTVSVILPTYNRAHLLPRAIASVLGQSYADLELVVVDDGSKDDTAAVMAAIRDPRVVYLPPDRNLGDAGARNRGIAHARGAWLAFQDSDDEWIPEKLMRQVTLAAKLPDEFGAVASSLLRIVGPAVDQIDWPAGVAHDGWAEVDRGAFVGGGSAYLQSLLVRRSAFDAVGPFDTGLKARSDFEFCLRLLQRYKAAVIHEPLAVSHETPDSISLRPDYRRHDLLRILEKHGAAIETHRRAASGYWYDLAKSQLMLGETGAALRSVAASIARRPGSARGWALLALIPAGPRPVTALSRWSLALRRRLRRA